MTPPAEPLAGVTIGHVGRQPDYTRDRIVAKALAHAGAEVVTVADRRRFPLRWARFATAVARGRFDAVVVSTLSQPDVPVVKLAARGRAPVIFDASISMYETAVEGRGTSRSGTWQARRHALSDRIACRAADLVLADTITHREYWRERFGTAKTRFGVVWLGADDDVMRPRAAERDDGRFRVLFYGTYSPLHGAEEIVRAAALLAAHDTIEFLMVGQGHTDSAVRALTEHLGVQSIRFLDRVAYDALPDLIANSDVCLGSFGVVEPANRVIPFKVFDGLAMRRPVVTAGTPAAREALTDRVHCRLCPAGDPAALAERLVELERDRVETRALAERGHELFRRTFSIAALSAEMAALVPPLLR